MSLLNLPVALWKKVSSTVDGLRQQAPGARMVGEFAVKHVTNEASKKVNEIIRPEGNASRSGDAPSE